MKEAKDSTERSESRINGELRKRGILIWWSGALNRRVTEGDQRNPNLLCVRERERERETERQSERHTDRERRGMNVVRGNRERERREREVSGTLLVTGCLQLWICPSLLLRNWSLKVFVCLGSYVALLLAAFTAISFKKQKQNKKNIIIILKVTTFHYYK